MTLCLRGAGPSYISLSMQCEPLDQTNLSNMEMHPRRRWKTDIAMRMIAGAHMGWAGCRWGRVAPHGSLCLSALAWCPLESSRTFPHWFRGGIALLTLTCRPALTIFWIYPAENTDSPKLVEFVFKP
jgi:hypothetical protein